MTDFEQPVPEAEVLLADATTPAWVKVALLGALKTDPVDAANAAEMLYRYLDARCRSILPDGSIT